MNAEVADTSSNCSRLIAQSVELCDHLELEHKVACPVCKAPRGRNDHAGDLPVVEETLEDVEDERVEVVVTVPCDIRSPPESSKVPRPEVMNRTDGTT